MIVANWKMNKTADESIEFIDSLKSEILNFKNEVVICPPFTSLYALKSLAEKYNFKLGAQNCFWEDKGAFTGEISASMLSLLGCEYVILGHSERRKYFSEDDEIINKKINIAIENKLKPILCVGESISQREEGIEKEFVTGQLKDCLIAVSSADMKEIIIAYEPIWSIGSGKAISPSDAEEMCSNIRNFLARKYDDNIASKVKILYGGSLNEKNCGEIFKMENINGGLIGGASLKKESFGKILSM